MTATMEKEVKRIKAIHKELEGKRTALVSMPPDQISEEEEDRLFDLYSSEIMLTITAEYDAQIKAFKPSEWFKGFIESFGPCESKRISAKQAEIFAKYLPFAEQRSSFSSFHGTCVATHPWFPSTNPMPKDWEKKDGALPHILMLGLISHR